ncbi:MAG: outer membrane beta-barrel protein [Chlorobi bacterium]|nr:outer membrane beta-barrel protein [Chlorobiota bacterium]
MKKILIIIFVLSNFSIIAQTSRQYVGISVGPSFPLGDFSKSDLSDSTSGFAKTGINLKVIYSYKLSHNFGLQLHFVFNANNIDNEALKNEAAASKSDYSFSVESNRPWNSGGIYLSPFLRLPISERFTWEIKGNIGLSSAHSPQFIVRGTNTESSEKTEYFREVAKAFGLGFGTGTSFMYKLNKYVLTLDLDYYYSNIHFKEITGWGWTSEDNPSGTPYNYAADRKISSAAISIGLAYFL